MKKADIAKLPEGHLDRYDWAHATRGSKSASRAAQASRLLRILDEDLEARFPDSRSVNEALRALLSIEAALPKRRARTRAA